MFLGEAKTPPDTRIYAVGDIHGCTHLLHQMFAAIEHDLAVNPVKHYEIITLGDYCDRGPDSKGTIEFLIERKTRGDLHCLMGNHDQRMIEFMTRPLETGDSFMTYGGRQALSSYGVDPYMETDLLTLSRQLKEAVPAAHKHFLQKLDLMLVRQDYVFVHAGINPDLSLDKQTADDLLWIRNKFITFEKSFGKIVVHGHTIHEPMDILPNRINCDTGAYESGVLSAIVLEGVLHRKLQVGI